MTPQINSLNEKSVDSFALFIRLNMSCVTFVMQNHYIRFGEWLTIVKGTSPLNEKRERGLDGKNGYFIIPQHLICYCPVWTN